ncbi:MAG: hypothetical protein CMD92_03145 [Gammaproteobacteria bacterium]|nr:hypothetical protein [Gammaproteobacteria bacterium]
MIVTLEKTLLDYLESPPGTMEKLIDRISPEIYERLKDVIALGRWNEQERLSKGQLGQCMQLLILYEAQHLESHERTGTPLQADCDGDYSDSEAITIMQAPRGDKH